MHVAIHLQSSFKNLFNKHEYSTYDAPSSILSALQVIYHLTTLWCRHYIPILRMGPVRQAHLSRVTALISGRAGIQSQGPHIPVLIIKNNNL